MNNSILLQGNRKIYLDAQGKWHGYTEYWVGLGPTQTFYTLWEHYFPCTPAAEHYNRPRFLQNLAQGQADAIAKANELTGLDLSEEVYDVTTHGEKIERHARAAGTFHFGRYNGLPIAEVYNGLHDHIPNKEGVAKPGLGRAYVTFLAQSTWVPSDIAAKNNLAYIGAVYGETEAEAGYFAISREWSRKAQDIIDSRPIPAQYNGQRVALKGTILGTKEVENDFGTCTKILFKSEEGFKLWGTCNHNCGRGDQISFTARVEVSKEDPTFGFFSRPTKIDISSAEVAA